MSENNCIHNHLASASQDAVLIDRPKRLSIDPLSHQEGVVGGEKCNSISGFFGCPRGSSSRMENGAAGKKMVLAGPSVGVQGLSAGSWTWVEPPKNGKKNAE